MSLKTPPPAEAGAMLSGCKEAEGKTLVVICAESQEGTKIFLSFDESKDQKKPSVRLETRLPSTKSNLFRSPGIGP
jgi:hypothetical protein